MDSQDIADQNTDFYKVIEDGINDRDEKFIGFLSHQMESLTENIIKSTLNVASVIDAGFLMELQDMKLKMESLPEKMKSLNLECIDEEQANLPYQSPVDHSEVAEFINGVKSIIINLQSVNSTTETTYQ